LELQETHSPGGAAAKANYTYCCAGFQPSSRCKAPVMSLQNSVSCPRNRYAGTNAVHRTQRKHSRILNIAAVTAEPTRFPCMQLRRLEHGENWVTTT
jgi:hypothetical protein